MPFRRRSLNPIQSEKHEIEWTNLAQDAGTTVTVNLATAVQASAINLRNEVKQGDHIKSIFLEFNVAPETITATKVVHWKVIKNPHGDSSHTGNEYNAKVKNQVLHRGMEMLVKDVGTVFKRIFVVRIPRGVQRMADGDTIDFLYQSTSTQTQNLCGFAIYRSYS